MKKKDKVKGGIRMAVGLLLTVCMIFAGALLPGGTAQAAPAIDISGTTKGSITIHKYEYNGTGGTAGTGKPGDSANVPNDAKALKGVEFTIYQVKDATELEAIYRGISAGTMPELSTYWDSATKELTDAGKALNAYSQSDLDNPATTDENGVVTFADLPVGIYLVVETDAPSQVTAKSAFLVSIPTTVDSNDWLYDVHVFPKNATTYGEDVKLIKKGSDGTTLEDVTFVLQRETKAEDDTVTWETVTVTNAQGNAAALKTDTSGEITVSDLPPGNYRLIETDIGDNSGYILDFSKVYEFVVNDNGSIGRKNVGDTYIVLKGEGDPAATVATITVINEKPDVEKKVKDKDGSWGQEADYSIGDTISYQVAISVPENIAKLKRFEVQDTPIGIKYKSGTLKVYEAAENGTMDTSKEITAAGNYTVTAGTPTDGFTVAFTMTGAIKDHAGKTIYITYDAELTEEAVISPGGVNAGNTNTVELIYSKYIKPTGDPGDYPELPPDEDDKIKDNTVVYTFKLDIVKNGKDGDSETPLEGVTFDLYKETTDEDTTKLTDDAAKAAGLDSSKKWKKVNSAALETDENGKISVEGLAKGIYYLVETQTNDGYNLLSKPIKVELTTTYTTVFKETYTDKNGVIIKHEVTENGTSVTQSVKVNDGTDVVTTVTILNTKGFTLPTTGGAGGFLFAVIGCVVMIVGIILFKGTKKKPESE